MLIFTFFSFFAPGCLLNISPLTFLHARQINDMMAIDMSVKLGWKRLANFFYIGFDLLNICLTYCAAAVAAAAVVAAAV